MAARIRKWLFYVYDVKDESGATIYVGKGSGRRSSVSARARGGIASEVARFKREADAYAFEVERIAELKPPANKHRGGNGSRVAIVRHSKSALEKRVEKIGSRRYAAMLAIAFHEAYGVPLSKVDEVRRVAYGSGA